MSDNTTAIRRLLDESNKLWDAMYVRGEVPTYGERYYFFRAMADAMYEDAKLRELVRDMWRFTGAACKKYPRLFDPVEPGGQTVRLNPIDAFEQRMRELGIEVDG